MRELRNNVRDGGSLIRKIAKDAIFNRMEEMKRGEDTPNDILSFILRASESLKESLSFGLEEILDEFVTFFIAGQDTTANLLASTILCLGRYPNIMERQELILFIVVVDIFIIIGFVCDVSLKALLSYVTAIL